MLTYKLKAVHINVIKNNAIYNCYDPTKIFSKKIEFTVEGTVEYQISLNNVLLKEINEMFVTGEFSLTKQEYINLSDKTIYNYSLQCLHKKLCIQDVELFFSGIRQGVIKNINTSEIEVSSYRVNSEEQNKLLNINILGTVIIEIGESKNTLTMSTDYKILRTELKNVDKTNKEQLIKYIKKMLRRVHIHK